MHDAPQDVLVDAYPEEEYWQDLLKVTGGVTNEALARLVIRASSTCRRLDARARRALPAAAVGRAACGAHQRILHGRGQGAGQFATTAVPSERLGVAVRYESPVDRLELHDGPFRRSVL